MSAAPLGYAKWGFFLAITLALPLLVLECGLRGYFATRVGPSVWFFGTRLHGREITPPQVKEARRSNQRSKHTVMSHPNRRGGYSKYFPHQVRIDHDKETGEAFRVGINGQGFRGDEFEVAKPPGVIRVVTLGASSTFGYYDRDNETYPYLLGRELNARCGGGRDYEVINLGIPHLKARQILQLFRAEALPLAPDVVTFYEGINDSTAVEEHAPEDTSDWVREVPVLTAVHLALRERLITVAFVDHLLVLRGIRIGAEELARFDAESFRAAREFLNAVARIRDESRVAGAHFIVATQQAKSGLVAREEITGMRYAQEVALVREKAGAQGRLTINQLYFLRHSLLMDQLAAWARASRVPLVDVLTALDEHRDVLLSWVHLSPEGNRMVAHAFADEILAHTCARSLDRDFAEPEPYSIP